ncbi:MAG: S41 family peptidase [Polyangiaceae bacterium]
MSARERGARAGRALLSRQGARAAVAVCAIAIPAGARAGEFDAAGRYVADADAAAFEDFTMPVRYLPDDAPPECMPVAFEVKEDPTAISGATSVRVVEQNADCQERFLVELPAVKASYKARVWVRHGLGTARMNVVYPAEAMRPILAAILAPTGRATSDGWIELASNDFPVDGTLVGADGTKPKVYLRLGDIASAEGVDVDALEIVPSGSYVEETACEGARDPVCGEDAVCIGNRCIRGEWSVPPLPPDTGLRDDIVDSMEGQLKTFFGGQKTRTVDLPLALSTLEGMRGATSAWKFWNGWATAMHQLHDWHTNTQGSILENPAPGRLNVCFIEGDADLSHGIAPSHPNYRDVLVAYTGASGAQGLHAGDRLVAIDGQHPIAWARALADVHWGFHVASDANSFADFPEALGGSALFGNGLIVRYAKEITVVRCANGACGAPPETLRVKDFVSADGMDSVSCDNRPFYHLGPTGPNPATHRVGGKFYRGMVDGTAPDEAIYGLVWNTLNGGGDPNSNVNKSISDAIADFRANAKGVILDHRTGNGGTLDAAELMTSWLRPPSVAAVTRMPMASAGYMGPFDTTEGLALVAAADAPDRFDVGGDSPVTIPVALLLHRDGSASDYMPFGMKGSPHVRIFGPGPTAGAFSTFIEFNYYGGLAFQFASGDTIAADGTSLMGRGVMPDVVVQQKQSDLLAGVDSIHEAALAWIRAENQP